MLFKNSIPVWLQFLNKEIGACGTKIQLTILTFIYSQISIISSKIARYKVIKTKPLNLRGYGKVISII